MTEPIPVSPQGFGWTAAGVWTGVIMLIGYVIRQAVPWRKTTIEADKQLRDDLLHRVEHLEQTLEKERKIRDAERALDRHRINNLNHCLDMLVALLETNPDRAHDFVVRIKEMRESQLQAEATEKALIHAAKIASETAE